MVKFSTDCKIIKSKIGIYNKFIPWRQDGLGFDYEKKYVVPQLYNVILLKMLFDSITLYILLKRGLCSLVVLL